MNRIWWNQVTNAVRFVSQITEALLDEKSILIRHTSGMPWKDEFEQTVKDAVKKQNSEKRFENVPSADNPGEYLLKEFCKKEKRAAYRPVKGYARFLAESDDIVLHDRYLWVQLQTAEDLDRWMAFASDYIKERGKDRKAVFIFDLQMKGNVIPKKGIKLFSFDDSISEYDRIVFSVLASSSVKENSFIKTYLAELVSNTAGNDIELCMNCILKHTEFLKNPLALIEKVCCEETRSDGSPFVYKKDKEEVEHLIWLSQIKTIYPFIEEYREEFVRRYGGAIQKQLPITAPYGEIYNDPKDVELGTLKYMADNGYMLLSPMEFERLKRFKEARNKLSHLSILTIDEIKEMI